MLIYIGVLSKVILDPLCGFPTVRRQSVLIKPREGAPAQATLLRCSSMPECPGETGILLGALAPAGPCPPAGPLVVKERPMDTDHVQFLSKLSVVKCAQARGEYFPPALLLAAFCALCQLQLPFLHSASSGSPPPLSQAPPLSWLFGPLSF